MKESTTCDVGTWIERTEKVDGKEAIAFLRVAEVEIPGRGYRVERCDIVSTDSDGAPSEWVARRTSWIHPTSLEDKRYQRISIWTWTTPEPEQKALPLDDRASLVAFLKAAAAAGDLAKDKLRAMGEAA